MNSVALFVSGGLVTLLVIAAMAVLVTGAVLDGRDDRARRAAGPAPDARSAGADQQDDAWVVDAA